MRVLVTGSAGFVGSRLARALLDRGDQVVGLDNLNDYYDIAHKKRNLADLETDAGFTFIREDLRHADRIGELVAEHQPQVIAHLAAMAAVRYSVQHPLIYGEVNVQGTMNLLDAARQIGRARVVLASTGSVYGASTPVPFQETAAADRPLAPYPASKRAMELMAHAYCHLWSLPTVVLRFFNVYGPHGRPDMMPWHWTMQMLRGEELTLFDGGHMKRDWTYVDDIVSGFIAAIDAETEGYEVMNLGCGHPVENVEFVKILEGLLGTTAKIKEVAAPTSEPKITYADVSKAKRLLGYAPKVRVTEGLARFVDWLRAEGLI